MNTTAAYPVTQLSGAWGTTSKRTVNKSKTYDPYWDLSEVTGTEKELVRAGQMINGITTEATTREMNRIVLETLHQTKKIAQKLKGSTTEQTLKNIARYFAEYYQFNEDHSSREQIRTPARAYKDRISPGIDCDCFSTSISSILVNLGIPHFWRKTKPSSRGDYAHIYVVVPKYPGASLSVRENYYVIDPVVGRFDYEHTNNRLPDYYDDYEVKLSGMNGFSLVPESFDPLKVAKYVGGALVFLLTATLAYNHINNTKKSSK